jgi:[ribosomal protein S5]-alanine N-acetyltransferase
VPAHEADPAAVLRFELENREYFRSWVPDRGDAYYHLEAVAASLRDARRWWDGGSDRLHVVRDRDDRVVARVNLTDVAECCGFLGYRVAESHGGSGIATAAVTDLLASASRWGIRRVCAVTSTANIGSTRVLERSGFSLARTRRGGLELGDTTLDALDWEAWISE